MKLAVWDITSRCNLRCKHCYNAEMYFKKTIKDMNLDEIKHMMDLLVKAQFTHLQLLGGEPFVSPYFEDVLEIAKKQSLQVYITTNGTIMTEDIMEVIFSSTVQQINFSFESHSALKNDYIRGKGVYETVLSNLQKFVERKKQLNNELIVGISHTITKYNYNELHKMIDFSSKSGADILIITTFIDSGAGKENIELFDEDLSKIIRYLIETLPEILPRYPDLTVQLDMRPYIVTYLRRRFLLKNLSFVSASTDCLAGDEMWYITANGMLHPCNVMINQDITNFPRELITPEKINIKDFDSFNDMTETKYIKEFCQLKKEEYLKRKKTCLNCDLQNVCYPCFIKLYTQTSIPECDIIQEEEEIYFKSLDFIIPKFSNQIIAYKSKEVLYLKNLDQNENIELKGLDLKIMELIYLKYNVKQIIDELNDIPTIKIYRVLLDYRYNDILKF